MRDYDINVEGIKYMFSLYPLSFHRFSENFYLGKCISYRQIFFFIFIDEFELFFLWHVAYLKSEFIARILVHVVTFLLMWLLETGDFDSLTHLKLTYEGWLNTLIM